MRSDNDSRANLLYAFFLSILFVIIDYAVLILLTEPLARLLPITDVRLSNIVHMTIMSLIGTALGCIAFISFRERKFLVPWAYSFFPVFILICCLFVVFNIDPEERRFAFSLIALYTVIPTIVGMAVSWGIYLLKYKTKPTD